MLKRLLSEEKGTISVLVAFSMVVMLGMAGLVLDVGYAYIEKQKLQNATDAACLAGAQELPDTAAAEGKAAECAARNGLSEAEVQFQFAVGNKRITAVSNRTVKLHFLPALGFRQFEISATAAAERSSPGLAFDYTLFSGSSSDTLKMNGNDLHVEGTAHTNQNFQANGNDIGVTGACEAVGTISTNGNSISVPYRYPHSSYVDMPDYESQVKAQAQSAGSVYNSTVHYNGNSINVNNSIYVNGEVHLNGNTINGAGAILATGDIHINGNCIAATTQDQVCIYSKGDIKINGNNIRIKGILYAPGGEIEMNGNNLVIEGKVIGYKVKFNGNDITISGGSSPVISLPGSSCRLVV